MQKLRFAIGMVMLLAIVGGCGGGEFAKERTVLETVTKALDTLAGAVEGVDSPEGLAGVLDTFSGQMEKILPEMKQLTADHPEWVNSPPEELAETFDNFKAAGDKFQGAMPKMMAIIGEHGENPVLKSALEKFQGIMAQL